MDDEKIRALFDEVKRDIAKEIISHLDTTKAEDLRFHCLLQRFVDHGVPIVISSENALDDELGPVGQWSVFISGNKAKTSRHMNDVKLFLEDYIKNHFGAEEVKQCSTQS